MFGSAGIANSWKKVTARRASHSRQQISDCTSGWPGSPRAVEQTRSAVRAKNLQTRSPHNPHDNLAKMSPISDGHPI